MTKFDSKNTDRLGMSCTRSCNGAEFTLRRQRLSNTSPAIALTFAASLFAIMLVAGCHSTKVGRDYALIGIWYEPPRDGGGAIVEARAADDILVIEKLGFNAMLVESPRPGDIRSLSNLAEETDVDIVAPDEGAAAFVKTGLMPPAYWAPLGLANHTQRARSRLVWLGNARDAETTRRIGEVAYWHHQAKRAPRSFAGWENHDTVVPSSLAATYVAPPASVYQANASAKESANVAWLDLTTAPADEADVGTRWLVAYHRELATGRAGGLLANRYQHNHGGTANFVGESGKISPKHAAAVKRITQRARRWAPRLLGSKTQPIATEAEDTPLRVVMFDGVRRKYVFLWNDSTDAFLRTTTTIRLPDAGRRASRLVAVPADDRTFVGEVEPVRQGRVRLTIDLPPGEGRLYEVFRTR